MTHGGFALQQEQRNPAPGRSLMKSLDIECTIGSDRLATRNEVRRAMSLPSQGTVELISDFDDLWEFDSDFHSQERQLPEDIMWLAIASELHDYTIN